MAAVKTSIDAEQAMFRRVGEYIANSGYQLATINGIKDSKPRIFLDGGGSGFGILKESETESKHGVISRFLRGKERKHVANLFFESKDHNADKNNWVMVAYGEKHFEEIGSLANKISSEFNVNMSVKTFRHERREDFDPQVTF